MTAPESIRTAAAGAVAAAGSADTKAAALLGALGLPAAVLAGLLPGQDVTGPAAVALATSATAVAVAMVAALLALLPRISGALPGTWVAWAKHGGVDALLTEPAVQHLARIAYRKHRLLQAAVLAALGAVAALAVAGLLAALA